MEGWTSNFLSYGGRITLVTAVLSAMPLHYMQAFRTPVGVIKHIDRMRRGVLWKGNEACKGINCLVNWDRVCALQMNGDLGIVDLTCQNNALLAKWIWSIEGGMGGLWTNTILSLYGISSASQLSSPRTEDSFFLKNLVDLIPFCRVSTETVGGVSTWKWTPSSTFTCASGIQGHAPHGMDLPISQHPLEGQDTHEDNDFYLVDA